MTDLKQAVTRLEQAAHAEQVAKFALQRLEDELMDGRLDRAVFSQAYEGWLEALQQKQMAERDVARAHGAIQEHAR